MLTECVVSSIGHNHCMGCQVMMVTGKISDLESLEATGDQQADLRPSSENWDRADGDPCKWCEDLTLRFIEGV